MLSDYEQIYEQRFWPYFEQFSASFQEKRNLRP